MASTASSWRINNRDRYNAYRRRWRSEHKSHMEIQNRKQNLKKCFGLTLEEFNAILEVQGGVCAICQGPPVNKKHLCVDHDHDTGKVRGLLCGPCNTALNRVEKFPSWGDKALSYLAKYKGVN